MTILLLLLLLTLIALTLAGRTPDSRDTSYSLRPLGPHADANGRPKARRYDGRKPS